MRFADVVGNSALKERFVKNITDNRISHAQLFVGNEGCGNLPMALAYAQFIFCENKSEDSCGKCPSCLKVSGFNHPDLHFAFPVHVTSGGVSDESLDKWRAQFKVGPYFGAPEWNTQLGDILKKGIIGVKECTNIMRKLHLKSFEGGYKVLIIWLPETMNIESGNKLLKLIEEPPPKTVILMVAESVDAMLPTVLSRTQLSKFSKLGDQEIIDYLVNEKQVDSETAHTISALSDGNLVEAIRLTSGAEMAMANLENFITWMRLCYQRNVAEILDWIDLSVARMGREGQKQFILYCLHLFRQCIVGHYSNGDLVKITESQKAFLAKFSPFINHLNIIELTEEFDKAYYHIDRNANAKILFMDVSMRIFALLRRNERATVQ